MLIANQLCERKALRLDDFRARLHKIRGGCIDTELKELTVRPIGRPSSPTEVTMTTPVVNDPSTLRSLCGSKSCKEGAGLIAAVTLVRSVVRRPSLSSGVVPNGSHVRDHLLSKENHGASGECGIEP